MPIPKHNPACAHQSDDAHLYSRFPTCAAKNGDLLPAHVTPRDLGLLASERHPSVGGVAQWLVVNPNLTGIVADTSRLFEDLAIALMHTLPDSPDLTHALRSLVTAKDDVVRCAVAVQREADQ